jgi:hypothetical protein
VKEGYCAVKVPLPLSYQTATEVGRAIVGIQLDGALEVGKCGIKISSVEFLGAAIEILHREASIDLRSTNDRVRQHADENQQKKGAAAYHCLLGILRFI